MNHDQVRDVDPAVADALEGEVDRQRETLQMIASENHASEAVIDAQGSALTNKYAEGYPGERYYGGCEFADEVEELAIDRATELFGAEHVNVQPHSGTQANQAVYFAMCEPGDKILSLDLNHGGHLSHGHPANFTGQLYEVEQYEVDPETGYLDYDDLADHAAEFDPDIIVSGYSAYPARSSGSAFRMPPTTSTRSTSRTSPTSPASWPLASTRRRSVSPTSSPARPTRPSAPAAAASSCATSSTPTTSTPPSSPAGRAVRSCTTSPARLSASKEALEPAFEDYAEQTVANAKALGESLSENGLSLVSEGTDNHLVLVDLRESHPDTTGGDAEEALEEAGIVLNGNTVPGETRSPFNPSGIRAGTPALTTRGFDEDDCRTVGDLIARVIDAPRTRPLSRTFASPSRRCATRTRCTNRRAGGQAVGSTHSVGYDH